MYFKRRLMKVETLCDEQNDFFDCEICLWQGVRVAKGDAEAARVQFEQHDCNDYISEYSVNRTGKSRF